MGEGERVVRREEGSRMAHTTVSQSEPLVQFPSLFLLLEGMSLTIPKLLLAAFGQLLQLPFHPGEKKNPHIVVQWSLRNSGYQNFKIQSVQNKIPPILYC